MLDQTSQQSSQSHQSQQSLSEEIKYVEVTTPSCGNFLKVYVQGDLDESQCRTVFLTCHDIGANHNSFYSFIKNRKMIEVRERGLFLHVCLPGQDDEEANLPPNFVFPPLDDIGRDLIHVLNKFEIEAVVAVGDGAGANIVAYFAHYHANRCYGVILIRLSPYIGGFVNFFSYKYLEWTLSANGMSQAVWEFLVQHRFGKNVEDGTEVIANMRDQLNSYNLSRYIRSYFHRGDLIPVLKQSFKVDALLVVGRLATMAKDVCAVYHLMSQINTTLLLVDDVADVMDEAPSNLARALILFCKGCSLLSGVSVPGYSRRRSNSETSLNTESEETAS